ncbi:hypothetical protein AAY473_014644 [Plecturocebus cupreus]
MMTTCHVPKLRHVLQTQQATKTTHTSQRQVVVSATNRASVIGSHMALWYQRLKNGPTRMKQHPIPATERVISNMTNAGQKNFFRIFFNLSHDVSSHHFERPRQMDYLRSGVQDQPSQHGKTPYLLKIQKLASVAIQETIN